MVCGSLFPYRGLATLLPRSAFMRALMSSCWQPIRFERSVMLFFPCTLGLNVSDDYSLVLRPYLTLHPLSPPLSFSLSHSLTLISISFNLPLPGSQQSQPIRHRRCSHWPFLLRDPWPGPGPGQWHHDSGESMWSSRVVCHKGLLLEFFSPSFSALSGSD